MGLKEFYEGAKEKYKAGAEKRAVEKAEQKQYNEELRIAKKAAAREAYKTASVARARREATEKANAPSFWQSIAGSAPQRAVSQAAPHTTTRRKKVWVKVKGKHGKSYYKPRYVTHRVTHKAAAPRQVAPPAFTMPDITGFGGGGSNGKQQGFAIPNMTGFGGGFGSKRGKKRKSNNIFDVGF